MQFTLSQIAQICSGKLYGADSFVDSFVTDSRSTLPAGNALFVAMRGVNHDAHMFVGDMVERGIIDPTKVTRSALQNAASVASTVLTTEALVVSQPEPVPAAPAGGMGGMGGMY